MNKFNFNNSLILILLLIGVFSVYVHNLSPSVYGGDSGDLIAAAIAKGVPHPSGYPLHTVLGILFLALPFSATPAWKVGLVSTTFSALAVVVTYLIVRELTKNRYLSLLTALTLAFLYPFWLYAEVAEVFALHSFFILIIIYFTLKYVNSKENKHLYVLSLLLGLSLTNNLIVVLLFPSTAFFVIISNPKILKNISLILKCIALFFAGLLPYLYIPIAASFKPSYNWGNAVNFKNFFDLVTRRMYNWGGNPLTSNYSPVEALRPYYLYWKLYITPLLPAFALAGSFYLIKIKKYSLYLYLITTFILLGPFFLVYAERGPVEAVLQLGITERFIIQSTLIVIIFLPFGVLFTVETIKRLLKRHRLVNLLEKTSLAIFFLIPLTSFIVNFGKTNLSDSWVGDYFAQDIFSSAPYGSLLLLKTDHYVFNSLYLQNAYNFRKDVSIPGPHTGFSQLIEKSPKLAYSIDLEKYNIKRANLIDENILLLSILDAVDSDTKLYVDVEAGLEDKKIIEVPYGLLNKLEYQEKYKQPKEEYLAEINGIWDSYHTKYLTENQWLISENIMLSDIRGLYVLSYLKTANFIRDHFKDNVEARKYEEKAFILDPLYLIRK